MTIFLIFKQRFLFLVSLTYLLLPTPYTCMYLLSLQRDNPEVCLDEAWNYFERVTLPRYFCDDIAKRQSGLERAARGETQRNTRLYSPWSTPLDELADFGIGVGLYFATLRALIVLLIIGGIINYPSLAYYSSEEYDTEISNKANGETGAFSYDQFTLTGSAVCTAQRFVICPQCGESLSKDRNMTHILDDHTATNNHTSPVTLTLWSKNTCTLIDTDHGRVSIANMVFILIAVIIMGKYIQKGKQALYTYIYFILNCNIFLTYKLFH